MLYNTKNLLHKNCNISELNGHTLYIVQHIVLKKKLLP